jgi:hypothetical protein
LDSTHGHNTPWLADLPSGDYERMRVCATRARALITASFTTEEFAFLQTQPAFQSAAQNITTLEEFEAVATLGNELICQLEERQLQTRT